MTGIAAGRELAKRLEAIEASVSERCVEAVLSARPDSGAEARPLAGGLAFFFGPMSPLSQAVGVGMQGPVSEEEFDGLEAFFLARQSPVAISLCPYAHPAVLERMGSRRYRATQFEHTLVRELGGGSAAFPALAESPARPAVLAQAGLWSRTVMEGFQEGAPAIEGMEDLFAIMFAAPGATGYLAWQDGRPAGGAAISIRAGDAAMFYGDSTLPEFRRRGLQSALIAARLRQASAAGCQLAVACTGPGTVSQRNYERAGFRVAYTKVLLVRDGRTQ